MKVYTCNTFAGYWPVGSAAVVVAEGKGEAIEILEAKLEEIGLSQKVMDWQLTEVALNNKQAIVLCDGNY